MKGLVVCSIEDTPLDVCSLEATRGRHAHLLLTTTRSLQHTTHHTHISIFMSRAAVLALYPYTVKPLKLYTFLDFTPAYILHKLLERTE